jgi:hypothetical protein
MFVESHVTLPLPIERAEPEVVRALRGSCLQHRSARAVGAGLQLMFVRPTLLPHRLAKLVRATVGEPYAASRTIVLPMRWEAVGPTARFYPALDARIGLTPVAELTTVLSLVGTYQPPMGRLGAGLDRAAMWRIATATVDTFLHQLEATVRDVTLSA